MRVVKGLKRPVSGKGRQGCASIAAPSSRGTIRTGGRPGTLTSLTALMIGLALMTPAQAQQPAAPAAAAPAPGSAGAAGGERRIAFDIPSQDLNVAILSFADKAGLQVFFDAARVQGLRSGAVIGTLSRQEALGRLLAGTNLTYRFTSANAVSLERLPAPQAGAAPGVVQLDPLQIQGQNWQPNAWDAGQGFVARHSATGTKTNTPLLEVPQAISVVTRAEMDALGVNTVNQAVRYTPGVFTDVQGADYRQDGNLYIRGFTADRYLDGLKLLSGAFTFPTAETYLMDRLSVIHGPASVLYGQASPGGFMDYTSKRPTAEPLHEIELQTGSYGMVQGAFDVGGPATPDGTLLYRFTGLARQTGSQVDHTGYERFAFAPSLTWRPNADTSLTVLTSLIHDPDAGFFNQLPSQGTLLPNRGGQIPINLYTGDEKFHQFKRTQGAIGYEFDHRLSDVWSFHQNLRYVNQRVDYRDVYPIGSYTADQLSVNRNAFINRETLNALSLDNHAKAAFSTGPFSHAVLFGVDYQHSSYEQRYAEAATSPLSLANPVYLPVVFPVNPPTNRVTNLTQDQAGLYMQDQVKLDRWALTVGGRQDWASSDTHNAPANTTTKKSDQAFTWRAGLLYLFDNGIAPYVNYTKSFQPANGTDRAGRPFDPTRGTQYEAGVKYQPTGGNSFMSVAAFQLTQTNVLTTDPQNALFSVQTGEVRVRGVELEGKADLGGGLNLIGSYTYLDDVNTKANSVILGKRPPAIPRNSASLWADYTVPPQFVAGLSAGLGVRAMDARPANNTNTVDIPGVALFDAAIRYDLGQLRPSLAGMQVSLNASNLADKHYIVTASNTVAFYGPLRTILATFRYKW